MEKDEAVGISSEFDLETALKHTKPGIRLKALEQITNKSCIELQSLLPLLKDPNKSVRLAVVAVLGMYREPRSAAAVGEILMHYEDRGLCKAAAATLGNICLPECIPYLNVGLKNGRAPAVQIACAKSLGQIGSPDAISVLIEALSWSKDSGLTAFLVTMLGNLRSTQAVPLILEALNHPEANVRKSALRSLYQTSTLLAFEHSLRLLKKDKDGNVRKFAAETLGNLQDHAAVPELIQAMFFDTADIVRSTAQLALTHFDDWKLKVDQVIQILKNSNLQQAEELDMEMIYQAITPVSLNGEEENLITDYLICKAQSIDPHQLVFLSRLIVCSTGGSQERAGKRLNDPEITKNIPKETLQELRIQVGGRTALDPIMQELRKDLDLYFQKPIYDLNLQTQSSWRSTILYAQIGFITRMLMSVAVFVVGIILLWLSGQQLLSGRLAAQDLYGPGIAFAGGLGTMLLVIYSGPLRDIRQSVNDLGAASAIFIAYIHRVLQISHTFSVYYMTQKIDFQEMQRSSRLMGEALAQTVNLLHQVPGNGSEQAIDEALKKISTAGPATNSPTSRQGDVE